MTTTLSTLIGLLANEMYSTRFTSLVSTSAGSTGGTTIVDTGLASLPSGGDSGAFAGFYARIAELVTSGPALGESQRITSYDPYTLTTVAFTATVQTGTSYEIHRYDPTDMKSAINNAVELLYPNLYTDKPYETLVVDNLIADPSFETNTTGPVAFTSWTNIGTPTLTAETSRKVHGSQAAGIAATGATEGLEQNLFTSVNIREVVNKTLRVRGWVFATVASAARIRVTFDGSTYTNGAWHGGDAEWENDSLQYIDVTVPADATEMTVSCEVTTGNTAYFDLVRAWIDPIYRYTIPTAILKGPYTLSLQRSLDTPEGPFDPIEDYDVLPGASGTRYFVLNHAAPPGYLLRIQGIGKLSTMSSDTATTEIDAPRTHLVVARAAQWLYENLRRDTAIGGRETYDVEAKEWRQRVQELLATPGMRMQNIGVPYNRKWSYG